MSYQTEQAWAAQAGSGRLVTTTRGSFRWAVRTKQWSQRSRSGCSRFQIDHHAAAALISEAVSRGYGGGGYVSRRGVVGGGGSIDKSPDVDWIQRHLDTYVQTYPLKAPMRLFDVSGGGCWRGSKCSDRDGCTAGQSAVPPAASPPPASLYTATRRSG